MIELKCLIIEDLAPAQRILTGYIGLLPNLKISGVFTSPLKALPILENEQIDILFLDVELPKISGIDFLKSLNTKPRVILTTAFSEYAVESFELDVVDYLLKPFSFERFLKSISKITKVVQENKPLLNRKDIFIKEKGVLQKINIDDILFIESKGDFVLFHTQNKRYMVNISLRETVETFGIDYIRCHKSYVVNISNIEKIDGNQIKIGGHNLPIGRTYKETLLSQIQSI